MTDDFDVLIQSLHQGCVVGWSVSRRERLRKALDAQGGAYEGDVTALLIAATGPLEDRLIEVIWNAVGLGDPPVDAVLLDSRVFTRYYPSPSGCSHVPDFCLVLPETDDRPLKLLAVVEAKGTAQVNGGWDYCSVRNGEYTNQPIAYPTGCWTSAPMDEVKMLWIGPDRYLDHPLGPWGGKGLVPADADRYGLGDAISDQNASREHWHSLGWTEIVEQLRETPEGVLVARVLANWASRLD